MAWPMGTNMIHTDEAEMIATPAKSDELEYDTGRPDSPFSMVCSEGDVANPRPSLLLRSRKSMSRRRGVSLTAASPADISCRQLIIDTNNVAASAAAEIELLDLLTKALIQVGVADDERSKKEDDIIASLARLYVRTPDQLKDALQIPEVLQQILGCIPGMLLPAVRAQLKYREDDRSKWMKLVGGANHHKSPDTSHNLNDPLLRKLQVMRVDFIHLADIDQVSQTFYARLFVMFRIKDGALDLDLTSDFEGFPFDHDGRPTFRPSGLWYLNQIEFPNGKDLKTTESKVTTEGNDLNLIKRVEGHFFERFELKDFPFDRQDLTVTISANCACEGPVPLEFVIVSPGSPKEPPSQLGVDITNFPHADIWDLSPHASASLATVGASARRFPAVHIRANVRRRSSFVLINAAVPISIISFLSLSTFFVPPDDTADRLELSTTTLLTSVAFKYTTSSYLPQISYMTLVDKFSVVCTLIIVIVCLDHTILGMLDRWAQVPYDMLEVLNKIFLVFAAVAWAGVQVWFVHSGRRVMKHKLLRWKSSTKRRGLW